MCEGGHANRLDIDMGGRIWACVAQRASKPHQIGQVQSILRKIILESPLKINNKLCFHSVLVKEVGRDDLVVYAVEAQAAIAGGRAPGPG